MEIYGVSRNITSSHTSLVDRAVSQPGEETSVTKYEIKFFGKPEFIGAKKKYTQKIVNGVRPMLPTSPDLPQIFYYQPEKFYKFTTHTPIPNTLRNYS